MKTDINECNVRDFERLLLAFMDHDDNWIQSFIKYYGAINILDSDKVEQIKVAIFRVSQNHGWRNNRRKKHSDRDTTLSMAHKCVYRFEKIIEETKEIVELLHNKPYEIEIKKPEQIELFEFMEVV